MDFGTYPTGWYIEVTCYVSQVAVSTGFTVQPSHGYLIRYVSLSLCLSYACNPHVPVRTEVKVEEFEA